MIAVKYIADDLTTWQISSPPEFAAAGAGNLLPASGAEPPLPGLWNPRNLRCEIVAGGVGPRIIHVVCNVSNPAWVAGPGSLITVNSQPYRVIACVGEIRDWVP